MTSHEKDERHRRLGLWASKCPVCEVDLPPGIMRDYCADHSLYAMTITQKIEEEKKRNVEIIAKRQKPIVDSILARDILLVCMVPRTTERLRRELSSNMYVPGESENADPRLFAIYLKFLVKQKLLRWKGRSQRGADVYETRSLPERQEDEAGLRLLRERWERLERRAPPPPPLPTPRAPRTPRLPRLRQEENPAESRAELSPAQPDPPPVQELVDEPASPPDPVETPHLRPDGADEDEETAASEDPLAWSEATTARWTALRTLPEEEVTRMFDRMEETAPAAVQQPAEVQRIEEQPSAPKEADDVDAFEEAPVDAPTRPTSASSVRRIAAAVSTLARAGALEGRDVCEVIRGLKAFV